MSARFVFCKTTDMETEEIGLRVMVPIGLKDEVSSENPGFGISHTHKSICPHNFGRIAEWKERCSRGVVEDAGVVEGSVCEELQLFSLLKAVGKRALQKSRLIPCRPPLKAPAKTGRNSGGLATGAGKPRV
ncbi:hypothetical protein TrVGV298_010135 [Trichoderma virens]|nr:hypothetical protein TrVGV298_010135 [Trichoderma virens]